MRFSIHLPAPRRSSAFDIDDLVAIARAVEEAGLHAACASDHPFPVVRRGLPGHHTYDPFVLLGQIAAATREIALIFSVLVVPYRNPFLTASMLATLDVASRGRVVAGLGAGYLRAEFDALGASYESRGDQIADAVQAMRAAWSGEPVHMDGAGWSARGNVLRPVPVAGPGLPLWRGGNGPLALRHAAEACDGWMPFEAGDALASNATTSPVTVRTIGKQVRAFRALREHAAPGRRADVCLVRTHPRWLEDEQRAVEEIGRLEADGVTWIETGLAGRSRAEVVEGVARLAAIARGAGLLAERTRP